MKVNQILLTKDGRVFGNAIIVKVNNCGKFNTYDIMTDYGNTGRNLSRKYILQQFHLASGELQKNCESHINYVYEKDKCPECGNEIEEKYSGVKCTNCNYTYCL